jgi:hypothetical protein
MRGPLGRAYKYHMATNDSAPRSKATTALLGIATGIFLVMLNWRSPVLRLEPSYLNNVVFGATCLSPWLVLFLVRPFRHVATRIVLRTMAIAVGVALLPLAVGSLAGEVRADLGTINTGRHTVKLYETDCGAPCSFGLAVRQERRVIPGLLLVRDIDGFYPAAAPTYVIINQDSIRIDVPPYGGRAPARSRGYRLYDLP